MLLYEINKKKQRRMRIEATRVYLIFNVLDKGQIIFRSIKSQSQKHGSTKIVQRLMIIKILLHCKVFLKHHVHSHVYGIFFFFLSVVLLIPIVAMYNFSFLLNLFLVPLDFIQTVLLLLISTILLASIY